MPIEEVASKLRVTTDHVKGWIQKGELRASDAGIKPYDYNKFKLDHDDEIRKAQADAKSNKGRPTQTKRKPDKKGIISKFFSFLGGSNSSAGTGDKNLAKENRKLKAEIEKLRGQEPEIQAEKEKLEEKVRYLESNMSRSRQLESEVTQLKQELAIVGSGGAPANNEALEKQLEQYRQELESAKQQAAQTEEYRSALEKTQNERDNLAQQLSAAREPGESEGASSPELEAELARTREALEQAQTQLQTLQQGPDQRDDMIAQLQAQLAQNADQPGDDILVGQLLAVQRANLARYQRLHQVCLETQAKLSQGGGAADSAELERLKQELAALADKHQALLTNKGTEQDYAEQLAAARVTTTRLKQENTRLKASLADSGADKWKQQIQELEQQLQEAQNNDASREVVESELRALRKSLQGREGQVQKIAGKLQENERALKKALEESARLTELLIERENKLKDMATQYEQDYREKIESLDRQVSGLQWKLSLREERIASLESEVNDLKRTSI